MSAGKPLSPKQVAALKKLEKTSDNELRTSADIPSDEQEERCESTLPAGDGSVSSDCVQKISMDPTGQEPLSAIERLSPADHLRLCKIARIAMTGRPSNPQDVVADALTAACNATARGTDQRWRRSETAMSYLSRMVRSAATDR